MGVPLRYPEAGEGEKEKFYITAPRSDGIKVKLTVAAVEPSSRPLPSVKSAVDAIQAGESSRVAAREECITPQ